MNYKIGKNTVQETLLIPLYAREMCSELLPESVPGRGGAAAGERGGL